jgi:hypothetical protein
MFNVSSLVFNGMTPEQMDILELFTDSNLRKMNQTETLLYNFTFIAPKFTEEVAKKGRCFEVMDAIGNDDVVALGKLITIPETDTNKSAEVIFRPLTKAPITNSLRPLSLVVLKGSRDMFLLLLQAANSYTLNIHLEDHYGKANIKWFNDRIIMHIIKKHDTLALDETIKATHEQGKKEKMLELRELTNQYHELTEVLPGSDVAHLTLEYLSSTFLELSSSLAK